MIGKTVTHYRILDELGRGGMGVVYKAEDTKLKRHVALKFLPADLTRDEEAKERFIQEAQAASALDHPNICTIHEIDETEDGLTFITMACYKGETLKEKIERGLLNLEEAIDIAVQVSQGMEKVHQKNMLHRDIKPGNIFITEEGVAKLLDFGLAKLAGQAELTRTGTTLGTVAYMSPEQAGGKEVDSRGDIWSLGVVLYEMLSGTLPFRGENEFVIINSILTQDPEPVENHRNDAPVDITTILERALQKNPGDRYHSVEEFRSDLQRILATDAPAAQSISSAERPVQEVRHNLPLQLTSFVGRVNEMAELRELLSDHRLITLTGAGGCGKTRLSLQIAADLVEDYRDGVWFVELAPVSDPRLVPDVVARTLQVPEEPDNPPLQTLSTYIKDMCLLLLLDNCEHLTEACSGLAHELLQASPESTILVTSRESLNTPGEVTWTVPSLSIPDPVEIPDDQQLYRFEAVKLFVDRAGAVQSKFELTPQNATSVARICHTLDGIPLAIELAAARIKFLSPADILERLEDRFQLLTGGLRTGLERHKTLRAAIDWSYELLSDPEQTLFNRISVFAGGFDMEAVEGVGAGGSLTDSSILDTFSMLVDKSLIVSDTQADGAVRYRLLETLRQYGREKLSESGEEELIRANHFRYFLKLADQAYDDQFDNASKWLHRLEIEHENLRAALDWSYSHPEKLIQLTGALGWFWITTGCYTSGLNYLQTALEKREGRTPAVARLLSSLGTSWFYIPAVFNDALVLLEESVNMWRELDNERETGLALIELGYLNCMTENFSYAERCCEESIEIFKNLDDLKLVARAKTPLCWAYIFQFQPDKAEPIAKETLAEALKYEMPREITLCRHFFADCALLYTAS